MKKIDNLIKSQALDLKQRDIINNILFSSYEKFAIKKAIEFKKLHSFKCRDIKTDELVLCSKVGLFKSIKKYNGNFSFTKYSEIYIKGELLKLLTSHYSSSLLPKHLRMKNKSNFTDIDLYNYKKILETRYISYSDNWKFDKFYNPNKNDNTVIDNIYSYENNKILWEKINTLDSFSKRIIYLKYDFDFNKIRSNKNISELMCCSEENVRKNLVKSIKQMVNI
jgi:RNA polymerase sigma factor (sigma-70 family)